MDINQEFTYQLFTELLNKMTINELADELSLHIGTLRRWKEWERVPINYYNELNSMLDFKYPKYESYRSKDQFYTSSTVAKYCFDKTNEIIESLGLNIEDYTYIEPSAGCCNFYNLLPKNRRIGIDIEPKGENQHELIELDYLKYEPEREGKFIVIGNPPFGLRGNLALRFINHSSKFADIVAFILPPLFDSTGKGVPMKRVRGYKLIHTEKLPLDSYYYPNGETVSIATIFQIWSKIGDINLAERKTQNVDEYIKIYSLSNGKTSSSKRNVKMIGKCDAYLPSTCFSGMKAYKSFDELPNKRGYGIVIKKNKETIKNHIFNIIDWEDVAFLSTNSAINLRSDLIVNELSKRGLLGGKNNE